MILQHVVLYDIIDLDYSINVYVALCCIIVNIVSRTHLHSAKGVQWKQGVVNYMMLCTILLYNTTPIHCTPLPLHPPLLRVSNSGRARSRQESASLEGTGISIIIIVIIIITIIITICNTTTISTISISSTITIILEGTQEVPRSGGRR